MNTSFPKMTSFTHFHKVFLSSFTLMGNVISLSFETLSLDTLERRALGSKIFLGAEENIGSGGADGIETEDFPPKEENIDDTFALIPGGGGGIFSEP